MIRYSKPFLLSNHGSNRATAYCFTNKIVTLNGKTHVVWTDSVSETRGRTFDHATGQWGPTIAIGAGVDNHNSPCLSADREGRLHVSYGPHHRDAFYPDPWPPGSFKWSVSPKPNSLENIGDKTNPMGFSGTYGYLLHTLGGVDCIAYRGGERPPSLMFQRQRANGNWENPQTLMAQDIPPGYTHVGPFVACDREGAIYVSGHYYSSLNGTSLGVNALKSADGGATWTDLAGKPTATPIYYDARFAVPHPPKEHDPRNWGIVFDSRNRLWAMAGKQGKTGRYLPLSRWTGSGWQTVDVGCFLPEDRIPVDGGFTIDAADRIHVMVAAASAASTRGWGDPSNEVFHLCSRDEGKTFECNQISPTDPTAGNWLPLISRPGPFHPVDKPVILYTHGASAARSGEGCHATVDTEVWAVFIEEID